MDYFTDKEPRELKERAFIISGIALFVFAVLLIRLWYMQIIQSSYYSELALTNASRTIKIRAPRGFIYDREGTLLVQNRPSFDLNIIPEDVRDWPATEALLKRLIGLDAETIHETIKKEKGKKRSPFQPVTLKEDIAWEEMVRVSAYEYELPGVSIDVDPRRVYTYGKAAAHLIGYLGEISEKEYALLKKKAGNDYGPGDPIGKYGMEKTYEKTLKGEDGGRRIEVDAAGRLVRVIDRIAPRQGSTIRLTIDIQAQLAAWEAMKDKSGAVVAIEPHTGRILALVSSPAFDPEAISNGLSADEWKSIVEDPLKALTNKAIQGQYPPASTFKLITAAAALDEGVITTSTKIHSGPTFKFGNREFRDWKRDGHGNIAVHRAIVESADTFFYQVGLKVGVDGLAKYSKRFGLGQKTGISLLDEKSGLVPSTDWKKRVYGAPWYEGETVSVSVGQGYMLVTPLQLALAYAAIANGGSIYVPQYIESASLDKNGESAETFAPKERSKVMVSNQTLSELISALRGVVSEDGGTARGINIAALGIAGKTGTAQVFKMKERPASATSLPYALRDHAWFAGFAPHDDPKIAVAVIVEHGGFGSAAAAPVAQKVIKAYLRYKDDPAAEKAKPLPAEPEEGDL